MPADTHAGSSRPLTLIIDGTSEFSTTLTEIVRKNLSRTITEQYKDSGGKIIAITFDPTFEHRLTSTLRQESGELVLGVPADVAVELHRKAAEVWKAAMDQGREKIILLCDARLRACLAQMSSRTLQMLSVVAYDEIVLGTHVESFETISIAAHEMTMMDEREPLAVGAAPR